MTGLASTLQAPAKLNLSLAVVGRRPDGYHELAGVMALVELADTLTLTPGCSGLRVNADPRESIPVARADNLAWRGLVAGARTDPEIACMTLEKHIPAGAGLGGGSSDAAAGWRLGRLLAGAGDEPTGAELAGELAALGADVPFFAAQGPAAYVEGVGERIRPLAPCAGHVVVAIPPFRLSTAAVFAELRPSDWSAEPPGAEVVPGRNDLLAPALRLRPELAAVFDVVRRAGGAPHLTGSGSASFVLTDDPQRAAAVAMALRREGVRTIETDLANQASRIEQLSIEIEEDEIEP